MWHKVNFLKSFPSPRLDAIPRLKEPSLPNYFPIAKERIHFPRIIAPWEFQSPSTRIWTRVAMFITNDYNHYTAGTQIYTVYISKRRQTLSLSLFHKRTRTFSPSQYLSYSPKRNESWAHCPRPRTGQNGNACGTMQFYTTSLEVRSLQVILKLNRPWSYITY